MRPWRFLFLLQSLALPVFAGMIQARVVPAAPTNLTPVVLHLWGQSGDPSIAPVLRAVRVNGTQVVVEMRPSGEGRISVVHNWDERVNLGPLPGGDYDVTIHYVRDGYEERVPIALQVRDVTTLPIEKHVIGKMQPIVLTSPEEQPAKAWLGEHRLWSYWVDRAWHLYPVQEVPAGLYDLKVEWRDGSVDVARNAVQVATMPEAAAFGERLLVPVFYNGFDSANMEWESVFENADWWEDQPWLDSHPQGVFLTVPGMSAPPYFLRIRRVLPGGGDSLFARWTRIPLVRESEFRERITLPLVILDPRRRAVLRVYSLEPTTVSCARCGGAIVTKRSRDGEPAFASVTIPALYPSPGGVTIELSARESPIWAMVASTDVATVDLEVVTP